MLASMVFVFGTLAEFAFVLFLNQFFGDMTQASNEPSNRSTKKKEEPLFVNRRKKEFKGSEINAKAMNQWAMISTRMCLSNGEKVSDGVVLARKIDIISFLAFNFSYFVFNIVYWTSY